MAISVYPGKLVAAVMVAFVSLGATLWFAIAKPESYYPRIVAGQSKPMVSLNAQGVASPEWDREVGVLLDIVQTRLDLLNAIESTSVSPMDCQVSKSSLCEKMDEARRDGLTAWEQLNNKTEGWRTHGGTIATPLNDAIVRLKVSIPKLGGSP